MSGLGFCLFSAQLHKWIKFTERQISLYQYRFMPYGQALGGHIGMKIDLDEFREPKPANTLPGMLKPPFVRHAGEHAPGGYGIDQR